MKRKPAITIRMAAAHWPTLDLGVHLPDGAEGVWMAHLGTFRAQAVRDGGLLPGPTRTWTVQTAPGTHRRVTGTFFVSRATWVAAASQSFPVTLKTRPESFHL